MPLDKDFLKYLIDDESDPDAHLANLAKSIADVDHRFEPQADILKTKDEFEAALGEGRFLPAPSILLKGGMKNPIFFNSTALRLSDDFSGLFDALKRASMLLQTGVQVALDFSTLRAARSLIGSSHLQSVGPTRFMELFERAPQGPQKTGLTFLLRVDHLDIEDYLVYAKEAPTHVQCNFGVTDEFLNALVAGTNFGLKHKVDGEVSREIVAEKIFASFFDLVSTGRPVSFVFSDHVTRFIKNRNLPENRVLDPNQQLVFPDELTASGIINLRAFITRTGIDLEGLGNTIETALHFLDNCFEKNFYFDEKALAATRQNLRVTLCPAGLGPALDALNPDRDESKMAKIIDRLRDAFMIKSVQASFKLGEKRGRRNRILYKGKSYETRHSQTIGQTKIPLLCEIANVPPYLFRRNMTFTDLLEIQKQHATWQKELDNIVSYRQTAKGLEAEMFKTLFLRAYELGIMTLDFG